MKTETTTGLITALILIAAVFAVYFVNTWPKENLPLCTNTESGLITEGPNSIWTTVNTLTFPQSNDSDCINNYIRDFPGDILLADDMREGYRVCGEEIPERYKVNPISVSERELAIREALEDFQQKLDTLKESVEDFRLEVEKTQKVEK